MKRKLLNEEKQVQARNEYEEQLQGMKLDDHLERLIDSEFAPPPSHRTKLRKNLLQKLRREHQNEDMSFHYQFQPLMMICLFDIDMLEMV